MRKVKIALAAIVGIVALPHMTLESFDPFGPLEPLYPMAPVAMAQDVPCAVPIGSAEGPGFSPQQQDYRSRLHALATGRGVKVAIIDTGVFWHEQFSRLEPGEDLVTPDNAESLNDCDIHGTVVASVIGARDMGIAPDATLLSIRQSSQHYRNSPDSESSGSLATMAEAVHSAIDNGADVISLSVVACISEERAATLDSHGLSEALGRAEDEEVVVLASAGNIDGECEPGMVVYPAVEDTVITVAALSSAYELAEYSLPVAQGQWVSAPGTVDIAVHPNGTGWMRGAIKNGTEGGFNGTSYATPTVSGTVALLLERNPHLTPAETREIIYASAQSAHHVHDPLAALGYLPESMPKEIRTVALSPETAEESPAPARLKMLIAATGAVVLLVLFITGVINNSRRQRSHVLAAKLPEVSGQSAKQPRERQRPKHRRARHRATRGAGQFLR